jgi:hypothetical protein
MSDVQLFRHTHQRLIQAKARLDADYKQIQAVRERQAEPMLARVNAPDEPEFRDQISKNRPQQRDDETQPVNPGGDSQGNQTNGQQDF